MRERPVRLTEPMSGCPAHGHQTAGAWRGNASAGASTLSEATLADASVPVINRIPPPKVKYAQNQLVIVEIRLRNPTRNAT